MTQITTVISVLIGGGILGFVQFLISRHDGKEDKESSILSEIKTLSVKVERIEKSLDERDAVLARTHILRFSDDIYNGIRHSKEYYDQTLDDLKTYTKYCEKNPGFANGRTEKAGEYIQKEYDRLIEEHNL